MRSLIDGRETLEEMVSDIRATNGEADYVYLLAWDVTDNFALIPGDPSSTFRRLMADASRRGVQIRAMLWAKPPGLNLLEKFRINALANGAAIRDDETPNKTPMSRIRLGAALLAAGVRQELIPVIIALIPPQDLARLGGAHHQKVLVVKRGNILVAYCGGIDINANRLNIVDAGSGQPHHDDHCRIVGPSAWDLLQTFIKRWRHHPDSAKIDSGPKGGLRGAGEPVPGPIAAPARIDAPFGGSTSVIIARTFTPTHKVPGVGPERDIKALLLAAIANAQRFIYLEDQYLVDLDTAAALNRAIPRLQHLTILILGSAINDMPLGREYRRDFVDRLTAGLSPVNAGKIGIFQLSTSQVKPVFGPHTYVHAKSWVFDDELAVIGSANCNRRGYQHDSEVDAFIFDDAPLRSNLTFAQQYRMRLWKEHLGVPPEMSSTGWRARRCGARPFGRRRRGSCRSTIACRETTPREFATWPPKNCGSSLIRFLDGGTVCERGSGPQNGLVDTCSRLRPGATEKVLGGTEGIHTLCVHQRAAGICRRHSKMCGVVGFPSPERRPGARASRSDISPPNRLRQLAPCTGSPHGSHLWPLRRAACRAARGMALAAL